MSLRHSIPEMIAEKLPPKGKRGGIDNTGLRKRPQFEQILNYLNFGQENIVYPDREAKLIRNHPFMTQLDFFDMQEDQKAQWEEQKRKQEAEVVAEKFGMSAASVKAMGTQTGRTRTSDSQSQTKGTQSASSDTQTGTGTGTGTRTNTGGTQTEMASSSNQNPIYNVTNLYGATGVTSSMQKGVRSRGNVPAEPFFAAGWQGNRPASGAAPATVAAAAVATTLAQQEQGVTNATASMDVEARKRLADAREKIGTKRQAMQEQVGAILAQPVPQSSAPATGALVNPDYMNQGTDQQKRANDVDDGERTNVKRIVTIHNGEEAKNIGFLGTSNGVMDERAKAMQENARIAAIQIVDAAGNGKSDFDGLANALGEAPPSAPEAVVPQAATPQVFNIGSPRASARGRRETEDSRTAYAAARAPPENVDSGNAPYSRSRGRSTVRKQNNFSEELNAEGILDFKLNNRANSAIAGKDRARTPRRQAQALRDASAIARSSKRQQKIEEVQAKQTKLFTDENSKKAIASQDAPRPTKEAPKLANESTTEEPEGKTPNWSSLSKPEIVTKILELFGDSKTRSSLMRMTKDNLVLYAQSPAKADKVEKTAKAPRASLVKPTTLKAGKTARRNRGVKA